MTDVFTWSCQDWVLEALEALHDEEYVDSSNFKEKLLETIISKAWLLGSLFFANFKKYPTDVVRTVKSSG